MEGVLDFCTSSQMICAGGISILLWGMVRRHYLKKDSSKSSKTEGGVQLIDGDVMNYSLGFCKPNTEALYYSGLPDGFNLRSLKAIYDILFRMLMRFEYHKVNILDARKRDNLSLEKNGFMIMNLKENFDTKEFETSEEIQQKFWDQLEPIILDLYPGAKVYQWGSCLFRGGKGQNPPAVDGVHLDMFPDAKRIEEYVGDANKKYYDTVGNGPRVDKSVLDSAKQVKLIGIWKPINMKNPVYDHPLAFMDASTFNASEDSVEFRQNMSHKDAGKMVAFKNLAGHIKYREDQKWYYYSDMTTDECVIFSHYTKTDGFACPHTSFKHPGAPKDVPFDTRQSVETRVQLYWE